MRSLLLFVLVALAGCGRPTAPAIVMYPVEGRLIVSGIPAVNAQVALHPIGEPTSSYHPVGTTGADGRFRLTTHTTGDGAPAGEYVVTVIWTNHELFGGDCPCGADPTQHDRLCGAYADPATSRLRATVRAQHNEITLETTVGGGGRGWNLPRRQDAAKKTDRVGPADRDRERKQ